MPILHPFLDRDDQQQLNQSLPELLHHMHSLQVDLPRMALAVLSSYTPEVSSFVLLWQ